MAAMVVAGYSSPLMTGMLARNRPEISFRVHLVSTLTFFPVLLLGAWLGGALGASVAKLVYYLLWSAMMAASHWRDLWRTAAAR
jgi:hypothetical protein